MTTTWVPVRSVPLRTSSVVESKPKVAMAACCPLHAAGAMMAGRREPSRAPHRLIDMAPTTSAISTRAVALAVAVLAAGCGIGWEDQAISGVSVSEDGRTLTVAWQCHLDSSVTAEESADEVRLQLRVYSYKGDCADVEVVTLQEPLGDRTIIDASTGQTVAPCASTDDVCV